jgi:hypothetical protein
MKTAAFVAVVFIVLALLFLVLKPEWLPFVLIGVVIAFCGAILVLVKPPIDEKKRWIEKAAKDFAKLLKIAGAEREKYEGIRKQFEAWGCTVTDDSVRVYSKKKLKRVRESEIFELKDELEKITKEIVKFKTMMSKCETERNTLIEQMKGVQEVIPLLPLELKVVELSSNQERLEFIAEKIKNWNVEHLDFDELATLEKALHDVSEHLKRVYSYVEEREKSIKARADTLKDSVNHEARRFKKASSALILPAEEVWNNVEGAGWCVEKAVKKLESVDLARSERYLNAAEEKLASAKHTIEFLEGLVIVISKKRTVYPMSKTRLETLSAFLERVIDEFNVNHMEVKLKKSEEGITIRYIERYRHKEALIAILTLIKRRIEGTILEAPKNTLHPTATEDAFFELKDLFINELGDRVILELRADSVFIDFRTGDVNRIVDTLIKKLRQ